MLNLAKVHDMSVWYYHNEIPLCNSYMLIKRDHADPSTKMQLQGKMSSTKPHVVPAEGMVPVTPVPEDLVGT
jgi:hypothetical protein